MAWNGSDQSSRKGEATSKSLLKGKSIATTKSLRLRLVASTLILLALAGAAVWCFLRPAPSPKIKQSKQSRNQTIQSVTPAPARTNAVAKVEEKVKENVDEPLRDEKGRPLLTNVIKNVPGRRTPRPVRIIKFSDKGHDKPQIFSTMSDCHLEQLVNYQPGDRFLSIVPPADIVRDFMAHVADKIEISPDDPPEVAERKCNYAEVREQIKKDILAGHDLEEMIVDARRTLDKIANMREEYLKTLNEAQMNGASDDELDDLATAATMLLKEHGANPILSPRQEMKFWETESTKQEN